jgi:hypothetical protein
LAASDKGDDLDAITGGEHGRGVEGARHDFAIALDGDGLSGQAEVTYQTRDSGSFVHQPLLSIDDYVDVDRHRGEATTTPPGWLAPGLYSSTLVDAARQM